MAGGGGGQLSGDAILRRRALAGKSGWVSIESLLLDAWVDGADGEIPHRLGWFIIVKYLLSQSSHH